MGLLFILRLCYTMPTDKTAVCNIDESLFTVQSFEFPEENQEDRIEAKRTKKK